MAKEFASVAHIYAVFKFEKLRDIDIEGGEECLKILGQGWWIVLFVSQFLTHGKQLVAWEHVMYKYSIFFCKVAN